MSTTSWNVTGMTCGHCVAAVTNELTAVEGVTDVQIDLVPEGASTVTVTSGTDVDEATVRAAVDEAGFELVGATP